ncbi:protein transporter Sec31 [Streptomyces asoensis]|uniref:Protein transporter Sec31 n=1 Tax=Streptomyces asoensis TaxID=249586 RepID=A0A6M4WV16_9ACTN|nr:protein transporter Sec31 [Streptomyces asoensis]QJT04374.1 protein transporter Sec31 [Streptomyces asoensis]
MKTRSIERTRLVPHTVDGVTEMVLDTETIEVPAPPRDWDQIVRTAVTIGATLLVTVALVWSTSAIGGLLAMSVVAVIAYAAGVAFDLTWIMCMAVEWLLRSDPERAKAPRRAGRWALAVSMAAVFAHGYVFDQMVVGAVGAAVSALAKGGWTIAMRVHARPLDSRTQQWVAKRRAALDGKLAMIPIQRELQRGEAVLDAERRSLTSDPDRGSADPDCGSDPQSGSASPLPTLAGPMTVKDAVRTARDSGITDPDAVLRYVHKVADANARPDTVGRYLRSA